MHKPTKKIITTSLAGACALVIASAGVGYTYFRPVLSVDETSLPRFVTHDVLSPQNIGAISRFRSGAGDSFTMGEETCRSMKQYFNPPSGTGFFDKNATPPSEIDHQTNIAVFSPIGGVITKIEDEQNALGKQFTIRSSANPAYSFRLFHVYPLNEVVEGKKVVSGERIGSKLPSQVIDVAVEVSTLRQGRVLVPYTSLLTEDLFATNYASRGAGSPSDLVISKTTRDAEPLTCNGEDFVFPKYGNVESGVKQRETEDYATLGKVL
jgi:hypothetical protein